MISSLSAAILVFLQGFDCCHLVKILNDLSFSAIFIGAVVSCQSFKWYKYLNLIFPDQFFPVGSLNQLPGFLNTDGKSSLIKLFV